MNRGGIGVGAVAGEGCGAGERVGAGRGRAWAQPQAFLPLRPWGWGRESGSPLVAAASQNPPGRAGGGPILDEAGPYPGFEEPQNQMLEWGGLSALFICREISVPSRYWFLQSTSGKRHKARYLLCDFNPPEGFNLRRNVCIHIAFLLKTLLKMEEPVLVLFPWGHLYHWQSPDPWSDSFDLPSLNRNIPDIEYEEFIAGFTW
ncbi:uncharacterized protein LOC135320994 isoform X2 [Camelus dromedarius]|uniref:uncharacterized protein LOC135320994 isoform X2 n=1 Tax=Camelus dromedarius TaxID=9838 RepID=UPI0031194118